MYNKLSQLHNDESTTDTINNESGERLCYKYPDETLSFQSAELQSVLSDITHNSTFSNEKKPCKYPVDSSIASLHELNSVLSSGTYSEPCLTIPFSENSKTYGSSYTTTTIEDSKNNNLEHIISYHKKGTTNIHHVNKNTENKVTKHYVHKKCNNTDSLKSTSNMANSMYLRTTLSNNSAYIQPLQSETDCTKHSKTDLNYFGTVAEEVQRNYMNNLHLIPEPDVEDTDIIRDDDNIFFSNDPACCNINATEDVTNKLFSYSELNYTSNVEIKPIPKNLVTQKCVQSLFLMKGTENEEHNLPNELTSNVKDSDNKIDVGKETHEVSEPLISHIRDILLPEDIKNKKFQKCEESTVKFISDRSLTLVSNNINKITNFITHVEHTRETVRNVHTERHVQYTQDKTKISGTKKHMNNNRPAEIREVLRSAYANKENMQPSFHPCCNNHMVNDNVDTRMSKNKTCSNKHSFEYNLVNSVLVPEPSGNVTEGKNQVTEKTKITNQSTNMFESENVSFKVKNKKQCISEMLTTEDKKHFQTKNTSQNHVKCVCNKTFTINYNKSRNNLDNEEHKSKDCESPVFSTTAISDADSSKVSKLGESNGEEYDVFISEGNKLKSHDMLKFDSANYSVMSQANSFVNEERNRLRKLSFNKRNDRMYTKNKSYNAKLDEDSCAAHYCRTHSGKQKLLADFRKHLFEDSFFENKIQDNELKLNIPFSELQTNRSISIQTENTSINFVNLNSNTRNYKKIDNFKHVNKSKGKPIKHTAWQTKCLTKYLISKLCPVYGIEAKIRCEKLVKFMSEKIKETVQNNTDFHLTVDEIKTELAKLNIIKRNMDFYLFVMKFFRAYEQDFVYKCVPCIQTFGRPNLLPRPSNGHLNKIIKKK